MHTKNRLAGETNSIKNENQYAFREGQSTMDHVYTLKEIQTEGHENNKPMALSIISMINLTRQKTEKSLKIKGL